MIQYCSLILKWFPLFLSPMIFIICPGLLSFRSMLILINITTDAHYSTLSPVPKWRLFLYTLHTLRLVHLSQISVQNLAIWHLNRYSLPPWKSCHWCYLSRFCSDGSFCPAFKLVCIPVYKYLMCLIINYSIHLFHPYHLTFVIEILTSARWPARQGVKIGK